MWNKFVRSLPAMIVIVIAASLFSSVVTYKQQLQAQTAVVAVKTVVAPMPHENDIVDEPTVVVPAATADEPAASVDEPAAPKPAPKAPDALLTITYPEVAKPGTLVEIDASASAAASLDWIVMPKPAPEHMRLIDGNKRMLITNGSPVEYTVVIAGASASGKIAMQVVKVKFETPKPPAPVTPPAPEVPLTPLAKAIADAVAKVPSSANKVTQTTTLAGNFASVASMIAAGVITTPDDVIKATSKLNREALGADADAWKPFTDTLQSELNTMSKDKKLDDMKQHESVWREISAALQRQLPC